MVLGAPGIARLPDFLAAAPIRNGTLVRLWLDHGGDLIDVHILYPSPRSASAKVRAFIDALVARFPGSAHW